jgi:hypothetical protein
MITVAVGSPSANSTVSYKLDRDLVFRGCIATIMAGATPTTVPQVVVSLRSDVSAFFWVQAGVGGAPLVGAILFSAGPVTYGSNSVQIPVPAGETLYVSFQLGGWALLLFDDPAS